METRKPEQMELESKQQALLANPKIYTNLHRKHVLNKRILLSAILVIVVLVILLVVIIPVLLSAETCRMENKETRQIFQMYSGEFVEEIIYVTDADVYINVVNEVEITYDFQTGLVFERYIDAITKVKSTCFARHLNESKPPSRYIEKNKDTARINLLNSSALVHSEPEQWVFTDTPVAERTRSIMSKTARRMCSGVAIYELNINVNTANRACASPDYSIVCFDHSVYRCVTVCFRDYHCRVTAGQLTTREEVWYCQKDCDHDNTHKYC